VRATVALARLVKQAQPRLWDFCLKLRHKDAVRAEMGVGRPFAHLSGMYPAERGCLAIVWPLAPHPGNKNEVIVWDLAHDPRELLGLDAATLRRRLYTRQEDLPEGEQRLPIKTIHVNKSPIVVANLRALGDAPQRFGLDLPAAQAHAAFAAALCPELDAIWPAVFARTQTPPPDVDEDLYGGFIGNDDRRTLQRLRGLPPAQLAARRTAFNDPRLEELLFRYRARNFPDTLTDAEQARWQQHCAERLHGGPEGPGALETFMAKVEELSDRATEAEDRRAQGILDALFEYADGLAGAGAGAEGG
jgi:exodeoxyribonuclease-1